MDHKTPAQNQTCVQHEQGHTKGTVCVMYVCLRLPVLLCDNATSSQPHTLLLSRGCPHVCVNVCAKRSPRADIPADVMAALATGCMPRPPDCKRQLDTDEHDCCPIIQIKALCAPNSTVDCPAWLDFARHLLLEDPINRDAASPRPNPVTNRPNILYFDGITHKGKYTKSEVMKNQN